MIWGEDMKNKIKNRKRKWILKSIYHILMISVTLLYIFPFVWMFFTSIKAPTELFRLPPEILPEKAMWINYIEVLDGVPFFRMLLNTLFVSCSVTFGQLIFCSMSGFAFARLKFPGRNALFGIFLATMMIPSMVTIVPVFTLMRQLGWIDTYQALIVPGFFGSAFGTFLTRQFFLTLPVQLEEAAKIDGAGFFKIYYKIFLPLTKPILATLGMFTMINVWNDFMWPLITIQSEHLKTITVGLATFQGIYGSKYHLLMAGTMISVFPVIILYVFLQKYFVKGITFSGIKG